MGLAFSKLGSFDKAIWAYDYSILIKEDFSSSYFNLAHIYFNKNEFNLAIENFENLSARGKSAPKSTPLYKFHCLWERNMDPNLGITLSSMDTGTEQTSTDIPIDEPKTRTSGTPTISVYIDYSNITAGIELKDGRHPINPHQLAGFLEAGRFCTDRQITGSFPGPDHPVWKQWTALNYRCRISGSGKGTRSTILERTLMIC